MKKQTTIFCLTLILVFTVVSTSGNALAKGPETYKVGAVMPLSGHAAFYGKWGQTGAIIATEEINEKGGINNVNVQVIYEDNVAQTTKSVNACNKLVRMDKVQYLFSGITKVIMAMAPIVNRNKVVLINATAQSPDLVKAGPYVLHIMANVGYEVKVFTRYMKETMPHIKTLATFVVKDEFGISLREALIEECKAVGIGYAGGEFMDFQAPTYKTQLAKLKALKPDAIYLASYGKQDMVLAFKQAQELGIEAQWLGFQGMATPGLWEETNGANEGAVFTQPLFDPKSDNLITKEYVARYKKKTGKMPELYGAQCYDAVHLFRHAVNYLNKKNLDYNGENLRNALLNIGKFKLSTGDLIFQSDGTCVKPVAIRKVVKGKFEDITVVPAM
jgi:ABC-type branched-subunit amino acid transport system substrate-binding protein